MVFLISDQGYFTFLYGYTKDNIHPGGWKKRRTNSHGLGLAPRARLEKSVILSLHYVLLWAKASAYSSEIPTKPLGMLIALFCWLLYSTSSLDCRFPPTFVDCLVLPTDSFSWLPPSADFCWLSDHSSLVLFRSRGKSNVQLLYVGFAPKLKPTRRMSNIVSHCLQSEILFLLFIQNQIAGG